ILPDSEVVHSPGSKDFDIVAFVTEQGGFLEAYREQVAGVWMSGAEVVERVAQNQSINPRLLLAILEYQSGWVSDPERPNGDEFYFPIRTGDRNHQGLYLQLNWTANALSDGYYGWRQVTPNTDATENRPNAGTVAFNQLLEELCSHPECGSGLIAIYHQLFGNPWDYVVDLYEEDLNQPSLILPFPGTNKWILTGGPHAAWGSGSPWAALDFAPKWDSRRRTSDKEVVAVADGIVARVDHGIVVLDLDGDGYEQTAWSIFYLHVVAAEAITEGVSVRQGQVIGEASSAGGVADGDHIHIARKYNGEWIPAVGPVPFELGGWRVRSGAEAYDGELYKEEGGCEATVPIWGSLRAAPFLECGSDNLS
ncbi:MAG: M23 family metallopeptidase, partial [Nitrospiraceae bacterium]